MAFFEDLSVFFNGAEFAVTAEFTPQGKATVSAQVIFDAPTVDVLGGDVLTDEYTMRYPATALVGIKAGDIGIIDGGQYKVREIRMLNDGKLKVAKLSKV